MRLTIYLFVFFFFCAGSNYAQQSECIESEPIKIGSFQNLYKISDKIYRSEQPKDTNWKVLADEGMKTVINLRHGNTNRKVPADLNIEMIHLPMKAYSIKYEKVVECLAIIYRTQSPCLIHCLHGSDRTGCVLACSRMVFCGWTKEKAIEEFLDEKFGYHRFWFPGILKFLENVDVERMKSDVLK